MNPNIFNMFVLHDNTVTTGGHVVPGTVLGAFLMESLLVVFDREEARVGFASSACPSTPSTPGPRIALVDGIHAGSGVWS